MRPPSADARLSRRLEALTRARPGRTAPATVHAAWLRAKAALDDRVAARARAVGDVPGAIRAEVEASRARIDATLLDRPPAPVGGGSGT